MGRYHLGGVILGLLTLGGIDFLRKRLLSKKEEKTSTNVHEAKVDCVSQLSDIDETKVDYTSQLPDDVLSSIPSRMTIKDVVKTSILSTRSYMSALLSEKILGSSKSVFVTFLGHKVVELEMHTFIQRKFSSEFGQLMHSVSKLGVERLHLNFSCGKIPTSQDINLHRNTFFEFSLELLAQASSLKSLFLSVCVVQPSVTLRLNSLKNLFLTSVLLKIGQLEGILSSCLNLNQLVIKYCKLPHELCIFGTVKSVLFADCGGLEEIDLQATKLHGFECFFNNRMQIFRNLRMLVLLFESMYNFDIVKVSPVLDVCPVLQSLHILQHKTYRQNARGSPIRPPLSPRDHTELKEVRFGGFHGTEEEIELAIYILKSATVLDQMFLSQYSIDPYFKAYYGRDIWKKREQERILIHRRLLGQAISMILVLLTLGGIDFLRKLSKKEEKASTKVHDASELPDDVLSSILSRMTIKDAVKTSILSTRWRYLFASMPTLQFGLDMFGFNYSDINLHRNTFFEFSHELLAQASSLKSLFLSVCVVQPSVTLRLNSLKNLFLTSVLLKIGQLEGILSSCLNLNQLVIKYCKLPHELCIFGTVKSVLFADCGGLEEIDLQATKLCEFEWFFDDKVRFYFSSVPVLERVKISLRGDASMPNIFGEFAVNLPAQVTHFPTETQIFRDLRMLALLFESTYDFDIQHKTYRRKSSGSRIRPPLSPTDHTELKEVRFGGFHGTKEEIELAIYILSSATVHEAKVDYASQLPDEILSSILSRITIKDAVKTSILSRRWRYLVASMPTLKFSLDMIGVNSSHHRCCPYSQQKFLKVVNQFLQHYSGRKVVGLCMFICIGREFSSEFGQLMHSISKLGTLFLIVTSVLFADCGGLEEIDLQATNLRGFVCFCDQKVRFYLSSVPVLERVQLSLRGDASMPYILGEFARDQVKSLIVTASDTQVTHFPTETRIFRNLTMLALLLVNTHYFDIVKVSPILNACPVLEYLDLLVSYLGSHIRSSLSPTYHAKLKEVRFGGFHGKGEEIELAIYILISAMVLDHMFLSQYSIGSYFTACNGRVILELLALGGLDFLRTRLLSKKEEKASTKVDEAKVDYASQDYASQLSDAHEAKVDYASQLPDDVLSLILSRMTTKDAVKTSILSTRWRYLFASMPTLQFSLDMFGVNYSGHTSQQKLMKTVNQFLQFYLGRKIVDLEMHMVIKREVFYSGAFAQLMHSISKLGVERLLLNFSCGKIPTSKYINLHHNTFYEFPLELLSKASSLKSLSLSDCAVRPSVRLRLNSLKNLYLTSVLLKSGQLEGILSSRVNPNQLVIKYCKLPHKLCISGTVKFVLFADCGGLEEIDLQATNLHGFECFL
ncbi:hypothetical protein P3L10_007097 [Capsicum annuum]